MEKTKLYEELFKKYSQGIYRYLLARVGDRELAADLVQDTFEQLGKYLKADRNIEYPKAWLFTVARNKMVKVSRAQLPNIEVGDLAEIEATDYDAELITQEMAQLAMAELAKLDGDTQDVILLKLWEDFKFKDISRQLEENTSTLKQRYYRGLEKIKKNIDSQTNRRYSPAFITTLLIAIPEKSSIFNLSNLISIKSMENSTSETGISAINSAGAAKGFSLSAVELLGVIIGTGTIVAALAFGTLLLTSDQINQETLTEDSVASEENNSIDQLEGNEVEEFLATEQSAEIQQAGSSELVTFTSSVYDELSFDYDTAIW